MGCGGSDQAEKQNAGTITYFAGIRSRGEPVFMVLSHGGIAYEAKLIDGEEWGKLKSTDEAKPPNFMPFRTDAEGTITQDTVPLMETFAKMGGKFVVDAKTKTLADRCNGGKTFLDPYVNLPDPTAVGVETSWDEALATAIGEWKELAKELGAGPFFAGAKPGYGEAFVFHNLSNILVVAEKEFKEGVGEEDAKKLMAFHKAFAALDGVKEYLAKRPAQFGAPGSKANPGK
jgi:hypothetical protein